jgi:hypothetical protein
VAFQQQRLGNPGNGDYEAWEAGLVHQAGEWRVGIEGGWAEDRLTGIEGSSWLVGEPQITDNLEVERPGRQLTQISLCC